MKTRRVTRLGTIALLLYVSISGVMAATFTQDTFISSSDLSWEGVDVVITNCTLTVDGPHIFRSLQVQNAGVLTHTPNTNGPQLFTFAAANEPHVLSATNPATLFNSYADTNTLIVLSTTKTTVYTAGIDYLVTSDGQNVQLTLTTNSTIPEGATVLVSYDWVEVIEGFTLYINNDVNVRPGGAINVSGKGYAGAQGINSGAGVTMFTNFPYSFGAGGGGGHGGAGGISSTFARGGATYDSTTNPITIGSGGGTGSGMGGAGGGSATILAGGNFQIDGVVLATGNRATNAHSGGGAGGSLFLSAETFSGSGVISANGGDGDTPDGGGGGGGRIALYFATNNFTGAMKAYGGAGFMTGGAGTIYLEADTDSAGQLLVINSGKRGTNTTFAAAVSNLTVSGGAVVRLPSTSLVVTNLLLGSNSWLVSPTASPMYVVVNGNATLESTAVINADSQATSGIGVGISSCGAGPGASYGGVGGASVCGAHSGAVYGSVSQPSMGSGTFDAHGGGFVNMTVAGTLWLDGRISANGAGALAPTSGSGSGGGVLLTVGTLSGAGGVFANGGSPSNFVSGGGGGGRIAIYYDTNSFAGLITAYGGTGTNAGGPGSIYLKSSSDPIPQIIFDNGGVKGATYLTTSVGNSDLTISGGALLTNFVGIFTLRNLVIRSNSLYTGQSPGSGVLTTIATNATIEAGGAMAVDGLSTVAYPIGGQVGGSDLTGTGGGGGGGAGYGSGSVTNNFTNGAGGLANLQYMNPTVPGGMGGGGAGPGGLGGGSINLNVPGTLQLDGRISANGVTGAGLNSGGGGGGSLRIAARTITGNGSITANGASGTGRGGSGGGGGIALYTDTNLFVGPVTAYGGGAGTNSGGAGTLFLNSFNQQGPFPPTLIVDNGGNAGAKTPITIQQPLVNLMISGGATVSNSASSALIQGNLFVGSNSQFIGVSTFSASNIMVSTGGSVNADGGNTTFNGATGQSLFGTGGGGGAAAYGGASGSNAIGGFASGSFVPGGRGGGTSPQGAFPGGNGGGIMTLHVNDTLQIDGKLSVDGAAGQVANTGGGGGGSLTFNAKVLSGTGIISANGGAGLALGGGGSGGHITASDITSNRFAGTFTARGGGGANFGGAGFISIVAGRPNAPPLTQYVVDNGGNVGAYTPLFINIPLTANLTVTGGAVVSNNVTLSPLNLFIGSNSAIRTFSSSPYHLIVQSNAIIQSSGSLTMDASFAGGSALGQSLGTRGGGGGGHGGFGGASFSNAPGGAVTPDSMSQPVGFGSAGGGGINLGSGGTLGGNGGGALQITIGGALQLDGRISANGGTAVSNLNSGGGSGGSVWIQAGKLLGTGAVSADGGTANNLGGGGGGGRVAVWFNTNLFTGAITARGGPGANAGGPGTVFLNPNAVNVRAPASLIFDNGGARGNVSALLTSIPQADLIVSNGASVGFAINAGLAPLWNNVVITSNSVLNAASNFNTLSLVVASNLDIQAGGKLTLDRQGYPANAGAGHGSWTFGSSGGGGHGGLGSSGIALSAAGGQAYDSAIDPIAPGSGGGSTVPTVGSAGGGAIFLTINGKLNVDGVLSVDGGDATSGQAGGGSGGSLSITAGIISGKGQISADGGNGDLFTSGGGAGGRIQEAFATNLFTGTLSARGGAGAGLAGGAGTIFLKTNTTSSSVMIVDNGRQMGTFTPLIPFGNGIATPSLALHNGAVGTLQGTLTVQDLLIDSGASLITQATNPPTINISVLQDALIDTNGAILNDSNGLAATPGNGAVDGYGNGGGGGYGGAGGASLTGAAGGASYGSSNHPVNVGGAGGLAPPVAGYSRGGGVIHLAVAQKLTVNGIISANGADGILDGSGGGAGGSIWLSASNFSGTGSLTASGGMGEGFEGGGGGGGRIAIYTSSNTFAGNLLAFGGEGANPGQNGTIYVPTSLLISGNVTDANGLAVGGVTLQPSGQASVMSDISGAYSITVPPLWNGSVTPMGSGIIVPSIRNYPTLLVDQLGQDFVITTPAAFQLSGSQNNATRNVTFNWYGLKGAQYQLESSSNLVDWTPYGAPYAGGNAPASLAIPPGGPQLFFRLHVVY